MAQRYVIFAGAGVSMVPPSSLPNWKTFNDAVIQALTDRLSAYTRRSLGDSALRTVTAKRDANVGFAPDYMADIIAEECGADYFRVLQALDTDAYNDCHAVIAALAKAGKCAAVVTTNFDRLFERAFEAHGVAYEAFYGPDHFERLAEALADEGKTPILKVHGSAEAPESMVDTLSQRVAGRPAALDQALGVLYARHPVVMVGFSGADLDYDPNYLGLRAASETNQGLTYLAYSAGAVRPAIRELAQAWHRPDAIVEGRLPEWLAQWSESLDVDVEPAPQPESPVDHAEALREHAAKWAKSLGDLQAINILVALTRAAGDDRSAGYLMYSFWRHYRTQQDMDQDVYSRFNHMLGRYLLEYGWTMESLRPRYISTIVMTQGDKQEAEDWAYGRQDNGFQFLARALQAKNGAAAADMAVCCALLGNAQQGLDMSFGAFRAAAEARYPPLVVDAAIRGAAVWALGSAWTDGMERLEAAERLAKSLGFEHKRAALLAHLVRFYAWKERPEDARRAYEEAARIAERLGLERVRLQAETAWGYALYEQKRYREAYDTILPVCEELQRTGRLADLTRSGLDLADAARGLMEQDPVNRAFEILEEHEIGYQPHVALAYAQFHWNNDEPDRARACARDAVAAADKTNNKAVRQMAESILERIGDSVES